MVVAPSTCTPGAAIETDATDPTSAHFLVVGNAGKANALDLGASSFKAAGASPFTFADGQNAAGFKSDPVGQMRSIYQQLNLGDFANVESKLLRYAMQSRGYRKNKYKLPTEVAKRVRGR